MTNSVVSKQHLLFKEYGMYVAVKLSLVYVIKPAEYVSMVGQGYGILCQAGIISLVMNVSCLFIMSLLCKGILSSMQTRTLGL